MVSVEHQRSQLFSNFKMNKNTIQQKVDNENYCPHKVHCPYEMCLYRNGSERYFKSRRDLKQHILKVHAEKKFLCEKCSKGFGSEWQRKYHERTCGQEWKCTCGQKYNRRETLLTHHRRTRHPYATDVMKPTMKSSIKRKERRVESPTVIVLPVSQTVVYGGFPGVSNLPLAVYSPVCAINNNLTHNRIILPKEPANATISSGPYSVQPVVSEAKITEIIQPPANKDNIKTFASVETQTVSMESTQTQTDTQIHVQNITTVIAETGNKKEQNVAATQTTRFPLESRASQCSPRTPNSLRNRRRSYRGTSIETQTVESIVGRIKSSLHSKSRISTKTMKKNSAAQSVWSCLNRLLTSTLSRSSSGTQTIPRGKVHHNTCASQTLTQTGSGLSSEQTAHEMLGLLATVCQHLKDNSLAKENRLESLQQSECEDNRPELMVKVDSQNVISDLLQVDNLKDVLTETFNLEESANTIASSGPLLSNIETQTSTMNCPDYFSSNMETQTTEDNLLADMELSHIQTQTPWDFLDFCENMNSNQLSADIQTDITGEDLTDIFEDALWTPSGTNLADVTDMETQTNNQMSNMELISSYTQTLDNSFPLDLPILT